MAVNNTVISTVGSAQAVSAQPPGPQPSLKEQAAAGYFRAIALWLNQPLAKHGVYVQVQADRPGCLKLVVEFERPPIQSHLVKFLCHRIWQLNSELIEGIYVQARPVNHRRVLWQQRIRIVTPAVKARHQHQATAAPQTASPLPPQIRTPEAKTVHLPTHHLKLLRSFLLTGSAVAAFLFGCLLEVVTAGSSPVLPTFSQESAKSAVRVQPSAPRAISSSQGMPPQLEATTVDYQADQPRSTVVDAALEPVGVITHYPASPAQPSLAATDDVTLLFGGDISLDDPVYDELDNAGQLFAGLKDYQAADLSMVTLGTTLASGATNLEEELRHRSRLDAVNLLKDSGVDIVNLSDETVMAFGEKGLEETLESLDREGLYRVGAGRNATEARRPEIIDVKGKRIAYLSYAQGGDNAAHDERGGVNAQAKLGIVQDIQALRDEVDWIVVNFRWQVDLPEEPAFWQTNLARLAIDQGADVVVGYHPHQLQGGEIYKGRPIAYSLGDFIFEADQPAADQDTVVLKVALKEDQMKVEFVPVKVRNALPQAMEGTEAAALLSKLEQVSAQFDTPMTPSMVLDLKTKPVPVDEASPDTPFVNPEAEDGLVEPEPPSAEPESPTKEGADGPDLDAPAPGQRPWFDFTPPGKDELNEWGPKVAPGQQKFKPIPNNSQDGDTEEIDAQLQPGQRHLQIWGPTRPTYADGADDTLPPEPSVAPTSPEPEAAPLPTHLEVVPENSNAPEPNAPKIEPQPESQPEAPALEAPAPADQPQGEPASGKAERGHSVDAENGDRSNDAVTPHGEPLVGPLGAKPTPAPQPQRVQPIVPEQGAVAARKAIGLDAAVPPQNGADSMKVANLRTERDAAAEPSDSDRAD